MNPALAAVFFLVSPARARPIAMDEAYRLALKRSEAIAADAEAVNQALARIDELKGAVMPHLNFLATETLQESPNSGFTSVDQKSLPQIQFQATQPLFSGFREFLAFKAGKKQAQSAAMTLRRAQSLLYQDVARAYLDLLRVQKEIGIRREIVTATDERIKQLEAWIRIGRSRESEALAARSQLAQSEAEIEITRGQERVAQELLRFLTGLDDDLEPPDVAAPSLEPVDGFLQRASERSDVVAAERSLEAADLATEINRRQRWPVVAALGDYYLKRYGFSSNIHYDAQFTLSLPIFTGGTIGAQVREAEAAARASAQSLSLARRSAEREVRTAYRTLEWSLAAAKALEKAADLAQSNTKAQTEDYRLSLVTNLDVLDSINVLSNTRITLNQTLEQAALARAQLEVAAGGPALPGEKP